jgi:hypothetical protein
MSPDNKALDIFEMVADAVMAKQKAWRHRAACRDGKVEDFFPKHDHVAAQAKSRALCNVCPVIAECKEEWKRMPVAMQRHGMWFGTTDTERRQMPELCE